MILVDTSVWVDHFRAGDARLSAALNTGAVCMHPFVIGELACGKLRDRRTILDLLQRLPMAPAASEVEVLVYIERRKLMGRGVGYVDVHLLASAALSGTLRLWTRDRRLAGVAAGLNLAYDERASARTGFRRP